MFIVAVWFYILARNRGAKPIHASGFQFIFRNLMKISKQGRQFFIRC